jgi:1-acyl-sn-glycerol-3-phosphate acyltransferase
VTSWRRTLDYGSRVIGSGLCFGVFCLCCVVASLTLFPLIGVTSPNPDARRRRIRRCLLFFYRMLLGLGRTLGMITYEMHGFERLAAPGQLVVANHPSLIDMLLIASRVPQLDCIVKDALLRQPFLRSVVRWADFIPNAAPQHLIDHCVATLRAGNSLLVFPEGTRSVPGQTLKMKRGAAHIALAAQCDLLPITIVCNPSALTKTDVWYRVPPRRPHWCVTVGEPIRLSTLLVAGESESRSARRITAHLVEYFGAQAGSPPIERAAIDGLGHDAESAMPATHS